jgi:hypothetical protein
MRVLLRKLPPMLGEVLANALTRESGVEIISDPGPPPPEAPPPDLVIVGGDRAGAGGTAELERWPRSRVLLISGAGRRASLVELRPRHRALGEMSLERLRQVVSRLAGRRD